jgi:hypothetical protein
MVIASSWSHVCYAHGGVDELKGAKIDVKTSIFLQFLLHLSMWCHFNGMWIMESYAYQIILGLEKYKMNKKFFQYQSLIWTKDV